MKITFDGILFFLTSLLRRTIVRVVFLPTHIFSFKKTIKIIAKENISTARIGDGELQWIDGVNRLYEPYSEKMAEDLLQVIKNKRKNLFICINPQIILKKCFNTHKAEKKYYNILLKNHFLMVFKYIPKLRRYGNASITWLHRDYVEKSIEKTNNIYLSFKEIWNDKRILVVEGVNVKFGMESGFLNNAHRVNRVICPDKNSYNIIDTIYNEILSIEKFYNIVLFALGPTATILVYRLSFLNSNTKFIDIGSLDEDYLMFLRDNNLSFRNFDKELEELYHSQIIFDLSGKV